MKSLQGVLLALVSMATLTACSPLIVVKEAPLCPRGEEPDKFEPCKLPGNISEGITYGELLRMMQKDRQNLEECELRQRYLVRQFEACNQAIGKHNEEIKKVK